jgi:hypothetical protein
VGVSLLPSLGSRCGSDPRDRDQCVQAQPDVGVLGGEMTIDHDRAEIDSQPPAGRHAFTSIAGQIHEQSLDAFGLDVDSEWRRRVSQLDLDVVSGHTFQNGLEIAYERVQIDEHRRAGLFVTERRKLMQKVGRTPHFVDQQFALLS